MPTYDQIKKEIAEKIARGMELGPDEEIISIPGIPGIMPVQHVIVKEVMIRGKAAQIDSGIADHIKRINESGLFTLASCSGLDRDHIGTEKLSAYLTIRVGEEAILEGGYLDIPPGHESVDWELVKKLEDVGKKSGWITDVSKFFMLIPAVSFYTPHTGTIENDEKVERELEPYQKEVRAAKGGPSDVFLGAINRRDAERKRLIEKYRVFHWDDEKILAAWDELTSNLISIASF